MQSDDLLQIVVLAKIIPDEEQAISSAAGIKLLVDLLQNSKNKDALALAADCIARLTHTRAGKCVLKIYNYKIIVMPPVFCSV